MRSFEERISAAVRGGIEALDPRRTVEALGEPLGNVVNSEERRRLLALGGQNKRLTEAAHRLLQAGGTRAELVGAAEALESNSAAMRQVESDAVARRRREALRVVED